MNPIENKNSTPPTPNYQNQLLRRQRMMRQRMLLRGGRFQKGKKIPTKTVNDSSSQKVEVKPNENLLLNKQPRENNIDLKKNNPQPVSNIKKENNLQSILNINKEKENIKIKKNDNNTLEPFIKKVDVINENLNSNFQHIELKETHSINSMQKYLLFKKKILFISFVKDIENSFEYLRNFVKNTRLFQLDSYFYFYENGSKDKTKELLKKWIKDNENIDCFFDDNIESKYDNSTMSILKNKLYKKSIEKYGKEFEYLVIFDTIFEEDISIEDFLKMFELKESWDMITSNVCYKNTNIYASPFTLRLLKDEDDIRFCYKKFDEKKQEEDWIDKVYEFKSWYRVKRAYGGLMILKKEIFEHHKLWDENLSKFENENMSLCRKVNHIFVSPHIIYHKSYLLKSIPKKHIMKESFPLKLDSIFYKNHIFIPFKKMDIFETLNRYMSSLCKNKRIYPYLSIENEKENDWLMFFDIIKFDKNDLVHLEVDDRKLFINSSEDCEDEFSKIYNSKQLFLNPDFYSWRKYVNYYFTKYISLNPWIQQGIQKEKEEFKDYFVIGIHYPSIRKHNTYTKEYFHKIDKLLEEKGNKVIIYLVCDNSSIISSFEHKYGDKIQYNKEIKRKDIDDILKWIDNKEIQEDKKKMKEIKDELLESFILSNTHHFIHSNTTLALTVSYLNPQLSMELIPSIE